MLFLQIAQKMMVHMRTVQRWKRNRAAIEAIGCGENRNLTRIRRVKYPHARQAVLELVDHAEETGDAITSFECKLAATSAELEHNPASEFRASKGWLSGTKKALGLKMKNLGGEQQKADREAADKYVKDISPFLQELAIPLGCIFNADESKIIFRPEIKSSLVREGEPAPAGRGVEKEGMTFMPCINATGWRSMVTL